MAQVTVEVNGRPYQVGCEDGQEAHLLELVRLFDRQVRAVSQDMGQLTETRLFLMAALLLADELWDSRSRMSGVQAELARLQSDRARIESKAAAALDGAAKRIEKLAAE
ncbi:cell division protein ZapA [Phenylobacterium sp.]|uniref:cell division protein ZapA n=1 Tax=Phenylobacterium sp. TaxID=1871053 RepID=UPI0027311F0F|nr:cell division protein ZapA [Phenylobacterium sp.]MDP1874421.1 cell division protein ZapA [Phenylobacterium sp.]MDP3300210.1 cell division protein ZapA [Phenylobacterium sp.]